MSVRLVCVALLHRTRLAQKQYRYLFYIYFLNFLLCPVGGSHQQPPSLPAPASPSIVLTVTEPRIQIAEVGSTIRLRCSGQSLVGRQVLLRWGKEGGSLPGGRAQDDRRGVLIITDVRHSDSGTYVCSGQDGINVVTETVVVNVGGGEFII